MGLQSLVLVINPLMVLSITLTMMKKKANMISKTTRSSLSTLYNPIIGKTQVISAVIQPGSCLHQETTPSLSPISSLPLRTPSRSSLKVWSKWVLSWSRTNESLCSKWIRRKIRRKSSLILLFRCLSFLLKQRTSNNSKIKQYEIL